MVTGIRWEGTTDGMKAIGLGHRILELAGWCLTMMESGSLRVTGREIAVDSNMTTVGTGTESGILNGTEIGTVTSRAIARPASSVRGRV
jgi:hypothetical protein